MELIENKPLVEPRVCLQTSTDKESLFEYEVSGENQTPLEEYIFQVVKREIKRQLSEKDAEIELLKEKIEELEGRLENNAYERALDRKRITKLETKPKKTSIKTEEHFNHIISILKATDYKRATVKFLSARIKLTKRRTWQIVLEMEKAGTVNVVWDPHHSKRKLVELKKQFG